MGKKPRIALLLMVKLFLNALLTQAHSGDHPALTTYHSLKLKTSFSQELLEDILKRQDGKTTIILISSEYYNMSDAMHVQLFPKRVTSSLMKTIRQSFIETNDQALYILDTDVEEIKNIVTIIRSYD